MDLVLWQIMGTSTKLNLLDASHLSMSHFLTVSCFTGAISWVTATPADVVKSRLQADTMHHRKYKGIVHCIIQSYKTEGLHVSLLLPSYVCNCNSVVHQITT